MKRKSNKAYYKWLDKIAEKKAQDWTVTPLRSLDPNMVFMQMANDPTYSYQAFYENNPLAANMMLMADGAAHFDDSGKTMYHPTFSNQSLFSGYPNEYNPLGITGGSWNEDGTEYTPSPSQLTNYFNYETTRDYLDKAESKPVRIVMPEYKDGKESKYYKFVETMGPSLYKEMQRKGVKNLQKFYEYAMKQMAAESQFGTSRVAKENFNFGGVKPGTKYTKFKSVDDYTRYWVDMMMRMYPNAVAAETPLEYATALRKNVQGNSYYEDSPQTYLNYIQNARTLSKYMQQFEKDNPDIYNTEAGVVNGNFQMPVFDKDGDLKTLLTTPVNPQPDMRTILNPNIEIPYKPSLYPAKHDRGKDGIHINPANRGKFNATKKRTGKTTEQLTHSKNPLTRKRAIFAQNARKWKH